MFESFIPKLKAHHRKIVFTEGADPRILEAAARLLSGTFLSPILLGKPDEIFAVAEDIGYNVRGADILDPESYPQLDEMADRLVELRNGKISKEKSLELVRQNNYFGTMLVKTGYADALLGGALYATADILRPALQIIKARPDCEIVSSCFILVRSSATGGKTMLVMGDCALNIHPTEDDLVHIALETAETAKKFGIEPRVAFLSYSTLGSGEGEDVDKMRNASRRAHEIAPDMILDGEIQFDAAVSPRVAHTKCPATNMAGHANTFIFPDINAGNIGYKIAQRMGSFEAYGPIIQGLQAPINDLSRGCDAEEVYAMALITAGMCDD